MPRKISRSSLNASTIDILNVIRTNASYAYQQQVPAVTTENDIPQVGAVIYGNPALSNEFINALVNRIAIVAVRSAVFNNPYAGLKKGYLEFGETIENVFVEIVKAMDFSQEKAESRELKRYLPKVHSVFHVKGSGKSLNIISGIKVCVHKDNLSLNRRCIRYTSLIIKGAHKPHLIRHSSKSNSCVIHCC